MKPLFVVISLVVGLPSLAGAQDIWASPAEEEPAPAAEEPAQPESTPAATEPPVASEAPEGAAGDIYLTTLRTGLGQVVVRDLASAVATLQQAAQMEPQRPEAYCFLGEAQRLRGESTEALAAYRSCTRFATSAGNAMLKATGLVGEALVMELDVARKLDAREAWERVLSGTDNAAARGLATTRLAAIEAVIELDKQYEPVRQRIAERAAKKS